MPSVTTGYDTSASGSHGNLIQLGRRLQRTTETANLIVAATHTGVWVSSISFRRVMVVGKATGAITIFLDLDYTGDGVADEVISSATGVDPIIPDRSCSAQQARIRITNSAAGIQDITAHLLLSD